MQENLPCFRRDVTPFHSEELVDWCWQVCVLVFQHGGRGQSATLVGAVKNMDSQKTSGCSARCSVRCSGRSGADRSYSQSLVAHQSTGYRMMTARAQAWYERLEVVTDVCD